MFIIYLFYHLCMICDINMSVLYTSPYGWIISHQDYIKNIYKNVSKDSNIVDLQLKSVLFNINSPYLRSGEKLIKNTRYNLKRKRKLITSNSNFEELIHEIDYIRAKYNLICNEICNRNIFVSTSHEDNKIAQNAAEICYNETEKYSLHNSFGSNTDPAMFQTINSARFLFPKMCRFYCKNITEISTCLLHEQFDLIVLDPPWWNKYIRRKNAKSNQGYQMLYNFDLSVIPINQILRDNGIVVAWCTNSPQHLRDLQDVIFPKWGIQSVAKWYWLKVTCKGEPICSFSDPPGKQPFEQIIFGVKQTNSSSSIPAQKLVISIPSAIHSHKPPLTDLLSEYIGDDNPKCLEIFARYLLPGWTSWGLEVTKLQHECLYELQ